MRSASGRPSGRMFWFWLGAAMFDTTAAGCAAARPGAEEHAVEISEDLPQTLGVGVILGSSNQCAHDFDAEACDFRYVFIRDVRERWA